MRLFAATGLALAWGVLAGTLDVLLVGSAAFASVPLALRYVAAAAVMQGAVSALAGWGLWWLSRLTINRRRFSAGSAVVFQVGAVLAPVALLSLRFVQKNFLPNEKVFSPAGLLASIVVLAVAIFSGLAAAYLLGAVCPRRRVFGGPARIFGWVGYLLWVGAVLITATGVPWGDPAAERGASRPNVILISIDSVRKDIFYEYLEKHASPALRGFAAGCRAYTNAYAASSHSLPSHASMFTGRYPPEHGAMLYSGGTHTDLGSPVAPNVELLAERLGAVGYQTAAVLSNGWLGPPYGLERGFQTFINYGDAHRLDYFGPLPALTVSVVGSYLGYVGRRLFPAKHANTRLFLDWLPRRDRSRPYFFFLHYIDMHVPNNPPKKYAERFCKVRFAGQGGSSMEKKMLAGEYYERDMPEVLAHFRNLNLASLARMDEILAPVLETILNGGHLDNTLVILTSDHGDNLFEKADIYGHNHVYNTSIHIPLFLHVPGESRGESFDHLVSHVDLAPTICALAGMTTQEGLKGIDLLGHSPRSGPDEGIYAHGWDLANGGWARALILPDGKKWIENATGVGELYDLRADPGEDDNLALVDPETVQRYRERMDAFAAAMDEVPSKPLELDRLPPEVIKQLKALGYLQ